jgi:hypothetical protein
MADDNKPIYYCDSCGKEINVGDYYYIPQVEGYPMFIFCELCIDQAKREAGEGH